MHWSLLPDIAAAVPKDLGDALPQAWQVAWGGHALRTQPQDFFQSNQFWPRRDTLAYSDALIGYAPAGLLGSGPVAAVARYNVLFLLAPALCFLGAYLLGRELGLARGAAVVAGLAYAYAPYRLDQYNHLHILSSGGIPLALFLMVRGQRRGRAGPVLAAWLVTAWQLLLGISLGLLLVYVLGVVGLVAIWAWWRRGRPAPNVRVLGAHLSGLLALGIVTAWLSRPYLSVLDQLPESERTLADVQTFSGSVLWSHLAAAEESTLWGPLTSAARERLTFPSEQTFFPGLVVALLALAGLLWSRGPLDRRVRVFLGVSVVTCAALALGATVSGPRSFSPYRLLFEFGPGFQAIRVPGRITTLTTLGLALLAGAGAQRFAQSACARGRPQRAVLLVPALALLVLFEGSALRTGDRDPTAFRTPRVEAAPPGFDELRGPVLHLPAAPEDNRRYLLWSTDRFTPMVNGRSSVLPGSFLRLLEASRSFPDPASLAALQEVGVCTVALHVRHLEGTAWSSWAGRPVDSLGITRAEDGPLVVYDLRPGASCGAHSSGASAQARGLEELLPEGE